jgi:hypothetical protein
MCPPEERMTIVIAASEVKTKLTIKSFEVEQLTIKPFGRFSLPKLTNLYRKISSGRLFVINTRAQ